MKFSKKNILVTGLAVSLAATMLIGGGTFAYLQGETRNVENTFKTNKVLVDLKETTGDEYNIIPGTSQPKDPKVTVDNTVDAYVYVEVTDTTDGLVTYEIADGWTKLDGYDNVYYREVEANADVKEFSVLKNDTVYYSAALENNDMLDKVGNLKEGIELTFKAYAIQKDPFTDEVAAYQMKNAVYTDNATEAKKALSNGNSIVLKDDINFNDYTEESASSSLYVSGKKVVTIDLNGKTITGRSESKYNNTIKAVNEAVITINGDGWVQGGSATSNSSPNNAIEATKKGKVIINGGTYTVGPDENGNGNSVVFSNGGDIVINDGFFYTDTPYNGIYWVLNKQDKTNGSITCYGGTFVNCDPSKTGTEPEGQSDNFVADGYHVESKRVGKDIWYTVVKDDQATQDFVTALENTEEVTLDNDITLYNSADVQKLANKKIDLNGNKLIVNGATTINVKENDTMTIENGTFEYNGTNETAISLFSGAGVTIKNVTFTTNATINVEAGSEPATLNIIDSTITSSDYYCVSTNAANNQTGKNVKINIENSTLATKETHDDQNDSTAILFNVPGTLIIENSTITGERQAVIVRCGTATITGSELICEGSCKYTAGQYDNAEKWGSGNEVPTAVLVVGNISGETSYPYDAACTLSNTELKFTNNLERPLIYAAACNGHTTTITGVEKDQVKKQGNEENITINEISE